MSLFFYLMRAYILEVLEDVFRENTSLFLLNLDISNDGHVQVVLDGDYGIVLKDCVAVSRKIETRLNELNIDFSLEVTSSGASEPLKQYRQYVKNIGRTLAVKTSNNTVKGTLAKVDKEHIMLIIEKKAQKPVGKGKITVKEDLEFLFSDIVEAKVVIKF